MPKVLISDSIDQIAEKILKSNNIQVDTITDLSSDKLKEIIIKYDGLIVRSATKATKEIIEAGHNLKIIGRAGAGIDNIDGLSVDKGNIKSNILYFDIDKEVEQSKKLAQQTKNVDLYPFEIVLNNIHFFETYPSRFRLVTHYGITENDVEKTLGVLNKMVN